MEMSLSFGNTVGGNVHAVVLAGGSGTRFWPLSRETCPKQVLRICGEESLLSQTIRRLEGIVPAENIWIVTTEEQSQDIRFHLAPLGSMVRKIRFINEPVRRNTAPAIALAAMSLAAISPESLMIVLPSDHIIPDTEHFLTDLKKAIRAAESNDLVTFGVKPTHPETRYGYIQVEGVVGPGKGNPAKVKRFVEKPDIETAKTYISSGDYYWNSGIFVWKTSRILSEIATHLPVLYHTLKEMERDLPRHGETLNNEMKQLYSSLEAISIDYGIMERSHGVLMIPACFCWSDLGSWTALDDVLEKDGQGNVHRGNTIDIGSRDSIVFAGERLVATLGLRDMVVVDTPDATLITPKGRVQEVGRIVDELKRNGREEHVLHKTVERPWGRYTVLEKGRGYKIKRIVLQPGARLSLQVHRHRSEHWVVVEGIAAVRRGNERIMIRVNESTYIPIGTKHRLENAGEGPLQIIEIQNGRYIEEDDIERFDDDYGRMIP
jgi:mannose-1-phosphate guanylyltransferase / mannose-6-phosphate isomerase